MRVLLFTIEMKVILGALGTMEKLKVIAKEVIRVSLFKIFHFEN